MTPRRARMVRLYGGGIAPLGSTRWEVEWQELTPAARRRRTADPAGYEHDHDGDEVNVTAHCKTKHLALAKALAVVNTRPPRTVYGVAMVTEQCVQWFVEADQIAEWADVGEPIEVVSDRDD